MKKINKLWVMEGTSYDRCIQFTHIRIKANIEGLKTTKILYQVEYPVFKENSKAEQYYISKKQLKSILSKYEYNMDLKPIVNKFNNLVDKIW